MIRTRSVVLASAVFIGFISVGGARVGAQDPVARAKQLYLEAAYDEALSALAALDSAEGREYRALCFLALGRDDEAERELEALYGVDPIYPIGPEDRPPRFSTMARHVRERVVPGRLRERFTAARMQFVSKEGDAGASGFVQVVALIDASDLRQTPALVELRLLAEAYADLLASQPPPLPAEAAAAAAPAAPSVTPTPHVVPSVPLRQNIPAVPSTVPRRGRPLTGALRLRIGADGRVKDVALERSFDGEYDGRMLAAARQWIYEPATQNGVPVESERVVNISVDPH